MTETDDIFSRVKDTNCHEEQLLGVKFKMYSRIFY